MSKSHEESIFLLISYISISFHSWDSIIMLGRIHSFAWFSKSLSLFISIRVNNSAKHRFSDIKVGIMTSILFLSDLETGFVNGTSSIKWITLCQPLAKLVNALFLAHKSILKYIWALLLRPGAFGAKLILSFTLFIANLQQQ